MYAFILHSADCTEISHSIASSINGNLPSAPPGFIWTPVPYPASDWTVALVDGVVSVVRKEVDHEAVLQIAKRAKADQVNVFRSGWIEVSPTSVGLVDSSEASRANMRDNAAVASYAQQSGQDYSINWRLSDNTEVPLDAAGMISLWMEVNAHVNASFDHSFQLKAAIDAAISVEALDAIDITSGWPSAPVQSPTEGN